MARVSNGLLLCLSLLAAGCEKPTDPVPSQAASVRLEWLPLPAGAIHRVAFGSCMSQYLPQPIWNRVVEAKPDLFLHLGDLVYADMFPGDRRIPGTVNLLEKMRVDLAMLAAKPEFQLLRESVPVMAVWDDHDFGTNDGGADFPFKERTRELFLDFFGEPSDSDRRRTPGLHVARIFGPPEQRLQIIMLDVRSFKGPQIPDTRSAEVKQALNIVGRYVPNPDPSVTLLGEEQWQWLERRLREEADMRLIASGIQFVAGEKGVESWGNYPRERQRLYELIAKTRARGVILLSGDAHFSEISRTDEGPYPLYDFTSSNLAQRSTGWEVFKNSHRVAGPYAGHHFGMVEIDWDAYPSPGIQLKVIALDGSVAYRHELSLDTLR